MGINERGIRLVKHFEGLRLTTYVDPVGVPTIGYGHTGPAARPGNTITEAEADALLAADLSEAEADVRRLVTVDLSEDQLAALVSFVFNLGAGSFASSTLLKLLNRGDAMAAAEQFTRWVYGSVRGRKVVLPGLLRRRTQERLLFLGLPLDLGGEFVPAGSPVMPMVATEDIPAEFEAFLAPAGLEHFAPGEFLALGHQHATPGSPAFGLNTLPPRELWPNIVGTAQVLDALRERVGAPVIVHSAYRSPAYNRAVGGETGSQHMRFNAIDFVVRNATSPADWAGVLKEMRSAGRFRGGIGTYPTFVHVDTRGVDATW